MTTGEDGPQQARPVDFDSDPGRFLASQAATRHFSSGGDVHGPVAERLHQQHPRGRVLDVGGGNGLLARHLLQRRMTSVVLDRADHLASAPGPVVRADACRIPFADGSFDAVAALWMLYHLSDPVRALREARRVLKSGGTFVACAPSRSNDPELGDVLPDWGSRSTFDAEDAVDVVGEVFDVVDVDRWDAPLVSLPDVAAIATFLRGRGLSAHDAAAKAASFPAPLTVTKRGVLVWARPR